MGFLLAVSIALSASPFCDGEKCAIYLHKGQKAPFDGDLLSTDVSIVLGQKADHCDKEIEREVGFIAAKKAIEADLQLNIFDIQLKAEQDKNARLQKALEESQPLLSTEAVVGISVGATLIAVGVLAYVLRTIPLGAN